MAVDKVEEVQAKVTTKKQPAPRKITDDTEVSVVSNCRGTLYYKSLTNVIREWGEQGDEQDMTVKELKEMKAQQVLFFKNNWITFPEDQLDIIKHLKVEKHYTNVVHPSDIDALFDKSFNEFSEALKNATVNVKSLILDKAREKFEAKELTDHHIIRLLEDTFQTDIDINNPR